MANFTAVFDACVLYPAPLRDLLLSVATKEQFRARWTNEIHNEWTRNVLAQSPDITAEQLQTIVSEGLFDSLVLPDPNDRHVLAAAIKR